MYVGLLSTEMEAPLSRRNAISNLDGLSLCTILDGVCTYRV